MRRVVPILLLCVLLPLHVVSLKSAAAARKLLPRGEETAYFIPGPLLKLTSLEFDGLAADVMFLRSLVFLGQTYERTEKPRVKDWEWRRLANDLGAATELDPYFLDPYYFGQANLTWEGGLYNETNTLLAKGSRYRDWDWSMPFFIGFNHFYFLHDNEQASTYLMEASKRPGATPLFASLATRLAIKGRQTETAIIFLEQMLEREEDERVQQDYRTRIEALQAILLLERNVARYTAVFGHPPVSLDELVEKRWLTQLPVDPYGGKFYIDPQGVIQTTSDLRHRE